MSSVGPTYRTTCPRYLFPRLHPYCGNLCVWVFPALPFSPSTLLYIVLEQALPILAVPYALCPRCQSLAFSGAQPLPPALCVIARRAFADRACSLCFVIPACAWYLSVCYLQHLQSSLGVTYLGRAEGPWRLAHDRQHCFSELVK